jgi:hypothetical protein
MAHLVLQEDSLMHGHPGKSCKTCRKTVRDELKLAVAYSASLQRCVMHQVCDHTLLEDEMCCSI